MQGIAAEPFGTTRAGEPVTRYTLENENGMRVSVLDYGCTVQRILVPDRRGALRDVVLGYDTIEAYEDGTNRCGALVGRVANRTARSRFTLDGREYTLTKNDGENHLHGVFERSMFEAQTAFGALLLRRVSPDGEEGYPGALTLRVCVRLTPDNALELIYDAAADAPTPVNLTNHSYFNLNGQDGSDVLEHLLTVHAGHFAEIDTQSIPTGRIVPVEGTALDFRSARRIGERIDGADGQLALAGGYDHSYFLGADDGTLRCAAEASSERSGIALACCTTQPAVQLYSGNYLSGAEAGKGGVRYPCRGGFCLETQHAPDSLHHAAFPGIILRPGEPYHQETVYRFSTLDGKEQNEWNRKRD